MPHGCKHSRSHRHHGVPHHGRGRRRIHCGGRYYRVHYPMYIVVTNDEICRSETNERDGIIIYYDRHGRVVAIKVIR